MFTKFTLCIFTLAATLFGGTAEGMPTRRIDQQVDTSTQVWEAACLAAGGGDNCRQRSVGAFQTLLFAALPCAQQEGADDMIDLAKQLQNATNTAQIQKMVQLAQVFAQQPRDSPESLSVPYCQSAPRNSELDGVFQCQFNGTDPVHFGGGLTVGEPGTVPYGLSAPVSPPGSCPANPQGTVPAGTQLVSITQNPGVGTGSVAGNAGVGAAPEAGQEGLGDNSAGEGGDEAGDSDVPASQGSTSTATAGGTSITTSGSTSTATSETTEGGGLRGARPQAPGTPFHGLFGF